MLMRIEQKFNQIAQQYPQLDFILESQKKANFQEIAEKSAQVAGYLTKQGIKSGDRIALYCQNSMEFVICYFAILKADATVVPLHLLLKEPALAVILKDAEITGFIYQIDFEQTVQQLIKPTPLLKSLICIGQPHLKSAVALNTLYNTHFSLPYKTTNNLAVILYTSATEGYPKGAMLSHRNLLSNCQSVYQALQLQPAQDRLMVVLPLFHAFAATVGMLTPALYGLTLIPLKKFDLTELSKAIEQHKATIFMGVPSMYHALLRFPPKNRSQWRSIRFCVSGGAALPAKIWQQFEQQFKIPLLEGDGPTECSPVTTVNPLNGIRKAHSIGLPVPNVEIQIFNSQGVVLKQGETGEICVRGENVTQGYWRMPKETQQSFFADWFRTGDLGYIDSAGYIFIIDRLKEMIIVNGLNIYPRLIEQVLLQHTEIKEAAVIAESHPSHGEIPIAYLVKKDPIKILQSNKIRKWCRSYLGHHEIPRKIIFIAELPKNKQGQVIKRILNKQGELERGIISE